MLGRIFVALLCLGLLAGCTLPASVHRIHPKTYRYHKVLLQLVPHYKYIIEEARQYNHEIADDLSLIIKLDFYDLNNDGQDEVFVSIENDIGYRLTRYYNMHIYQLDANHKWRPIDNNDVLFTPYVSVLEQTTDGYHDLGHTRVVGGIFYHMTYKWHHNGYVLSEINNRGYHTVGF